LFRGYLFISNDINSDIEVPVLGWAIDVANTKRLKLTIELVPSTIWFSSLYRLMSKSNWRALKEEIYEKEGKRCYICGSTRPPFELHEFWEYDDEARVQKLVGIHHLCRLCHMVKHIGFWCHTSNGREKLEKLGLSRNDLIAHFCRVNGCSEKEFFRHEDEAFKIWEWRSKYDWRQDFGKYERFLTLKKHRRKRS